MSWRRTPAAQIVTILIVDDHRLTRIGLAEMLTSAGYRVVTAATFPEARQMLSEFRPDLLIADVRLGSFNGLQLVITGQTRVPAIVITGHDDPVLEAEARRGGADYFVKPVEPELLLARIRERLANARSGEPSPRRWRRREVAGLTARLGGYRVRIVDLSYGGVKFEMESSAPEPLPEAFELEFPDALSVQADLIWSRPLAAERRMCGAAVWPDESRARQWFGLVDTAVAPASSSSS
jgi:CheY-like chemotaxis protein